MGKTSKILISLLLLVSIVCSFASCELLPWHKEYTGGISAESHFYSNKEIHWVETYEEAMVAIQHLEAAGNKFERTAISNYENDTVDAKYCFILNTRDSEKPQDGQSWYDRKCVHGISVFYVGFLDKISIEDLEYSYYDSQRHFRIFDMHYHSLEDPSKLHCRCYNDEVTGRSCRVFYDSTPIVEIKYGGLIKNHYEEFPENFHKEFPKSVVFIGEEHK